MRPPHFFAHLFIDRTIVLEAIIMILVEQWHAISINHRALRQPLPELAKPDLGAEGLLIVPAPPLLPAA